MERPDGWGKRGRLAETPNVQLPALVLCALNLHLPRRREHQLAGFHFGLRWRTASAAFAAAYEQDTWHTAATHRNRVSFADTDSTPAAATAPVVAYLEAAAVGAQCWERRLGIRTGTARKVALAEVVAERHCLRDSTYAEEEDGGGIGEQSLGSRA